MKYLSVLLLSLTTLFAHAEEANLQEKLGFAKNDVVIIVNADDYGASKPHTDATTELFDKTDFVKTATIMTTTPDFERAAKIAKAEGYKVGVHLTLTNEWQEKEPWHTVLPKEEVPSLYNEKGLLWASAEEVAKNATPEDVEKELEAQIIKVKEAGIDPTHMDAHMYVYYNWYGEKFLPIVKKLSKKYGIHLSVKFMDTKEQNKKLREGGNMVADEYLVVYQIDDKGNLGTYKQRRDAYVKLLSELTPGVYHLTIHPALDTKESRRIYPHWNPRNSDYKIWFSDEIKNVVKKNNIKFTDYSKFNELEREFKVLSLKESNRS